MTTKTTKTAKASKKTTTLHIATPGSGKPICGASGKGIKTTLTAAEASCADCQKIAAHAEEKAKNDSKATETKKAEKPEVKKAEKPAAEPRERDSRLPPPGTLLKKLDRGGAVRCECKVTETGFRYNGEEYRSLSAAAMAAAKDLGISGSQNLWCEPAYVAPAGVAGRERPARLPISRAQIVLAEQGGGSGLSCYPAPREPS